LVGWTGLLGLVGFADFAGLGAFDAFDALLAVFFAFFIAQVGSTKAPNVIAATSQRQSEIRSEGNFPRPKAEWRLADLTN
jgi:hypothetical protein